MRLDRYVAEAAGVTRSEAKNLLQKGRVRLNGVVCKKGETQCAPTDTVQVDGVTAGRQQFVYIMLNKPQGVVSASEDRRDTTVVDLVQKDFPRRQLFPAGRLDKTSTGFVLITDDGGFAHDILSPRHHVDKTYRVELDAPVTEAVREAFARGVTLADGQTLDPAEIEPLTADGRTARVVLHQGVYHQIKRMLGVYGIGVNGLHRLAVGPVQLDEGLAPGQWRQLTEAELAALKSRV